MCFVLYVRVFPFSQLIIFFNNIFFSRCAREPPSLSSRPLGGASSRKGSRIVLSTYTENMYVLNMYVCISHRTKTLVTYPTYLVCISQRTRLRHTYQTQGICMYVYLNLGGRTPQVENRSFKV